MSISKIKIKGQNKLYENTSIQFTPIGMYVRVSLNIAPELIKFLPKENIEKGDKIWTYSLRKHIDSKYVNDANFNIIQEMLLKRCMIRIREAKQKLLQSEILILEK